MFSGESADGFKDYQRNSENRPAGLGGVQSEGFPDGDEPDTTHQRDCDGRYPTGEKDRLPNGSGEGVVGGIISQMRDLQQSHLAYVDAHEERLRKRLAESQEHRRKVAENMERLERQAMRLLNEMSNHQVKE